MEQHGIESGGGQKIEVFRHDPLEALKKALHGSRFLGYETLEVADAKVIGIIASDQLCDQIDEVDHEHPIVVVLDKTPFYGEMGGQVGDTGEIVGPGFLFEVIDTQVDGGFTLHRGHLREGRIELGATATARVDAERRQGIRRAHSATHFLHYALQKLLGKHALQQGSKVDDDLLRFDFANPSAVSERGTGPHRERSERPDSGGRADRPRRIAAGRSPQRRGHDALRREVSRRGPHGFRWAISARNFAAARI